MLETVPNTSVMMVRPLRRDWVMKACTNASTAEVGCVAWSGSWWKNQFGPFLLSQLSWPLPFSASAIGWHSVKVLIRCHWYWYWSSQPLELQEIHFIFFTNYSVSCILYSNKKHMKTLLYPLFLTVEWQLFSDPQRPWLMKHLLGAIPCIRSQRRRNPQRVSK